MAKTKAAGAVIERDLVRRKLRRMLRAHPWNTSLPAQNTIDHLLDWLDAQPKRTTRKGGIGRK